MIRPWVKVIARFHTTPIFARMWLGVATMTAYSIGVASFDAFLLPEAHTLGAGLHGVLGVVLGTLLVFRTNTSYDRWWESRKVWGSIVNDSRSLVIQLKNLAPAGNETRSETSRPWIKSRGCTAP